MVFRIFSVGLKPLLAAAVLSFVFAENASGAISLSSISRDGSCAWNSAPFGRTLATSGLDGADFSAHPYANEEATAQFIQTSDAFTQYSGTNAHIGAVLFSGSTQLYAVAEPADASAYTTFSMSFTLSVPTSYSLTYRYEVAAGMTGAAASSDISAKASASFSFTGASSSNVAGPSNFDYSVDQSDFPYFTGDESDYPGHTGYVGASIGFTNQSGTLGVGTYTISSDVYSEYKNPSPASIQSGGGQSLYQFSLNLDEGGMYDLVAQVPEPSVGVCLAVCVFGLRRRR